MKKIFLLFFILTYPLFSNILDHTKPIQGEKQCKSIKGVDFIYMINLDHRKDKLNHSLKELAPYGIVPYRFSAIEGKKLSLETINSIGVKYEPWMKTDLSCCYYSKEFPNGKHEQKLTLPGRTYFFNKLNRGEIGCFLSHLSVLKDAYESGFETVWIMEDDIHVIKNPHIISSYIEQLDNEVGKEGWDMLFTDADMEDSDYARSPCSFFHHRPDFSPNKDKIDFRKNISPDLRKIGGRNGAYSFILRRAGIKKIVDYISSYQMFLPYDVEFYMHPEIHLFEVRKDIISVNLAVGSDIR